MNHTLSCVKKEVVQNLCLTNREIFQYCNKEDSKNHQVSSLKQITRNVKPVTRLLLKAVHKHKKLKWAEEYMKIYFSIVLFTDKCCTSLDGLDGWSKN